MRCTIAILLVSSLAFADPPADPPQSVHLEPGQPAPFAGRLLSSEAFVASEKACADDHAFRASAMSDGAIRMSPIAIVVIVAGSLAVGAAVAAGVVVAVKR